ncbi:hypothetical protein [Streptomyces antibioticus]|uniref:hypothetical protein n=1 Tax=Streptomyces antibioticus TaxID=1890 RepID=UPI0033A59231
MRTPRKTLVATSLTIVLLTSAGPALAEGVTPTPTETAVVGTAPPATPEESDLVEGAPETTAAAPSIGSLPDDEPTPTRTAKPSETLDARACEPGWRYNATSKDKDYHWGVGPENANYNRSSQTARSTFVSEVTGSVGIGVSGELKVGGSWVVLEIEGKFSVNVSVSLTAKLGNQISVNTPPRKTTHAKYGVYRLKSYGYNQYVYANCTKSGKTNVTTYTPHRVGWVIWES